MSEKENQDPVVKTEEAAAAAAAPAPVTPEKKATKPKKKRSRKESEEPSAEKPEAAAESAEPPKKKQAKKKVLSNLARKKADERYVQNGKGRYVSKKKSENGKRNVQARAIKSGRSLLKLDGQMVLLGRGKKGEHLLTLTRKIRALLKEGMKDEDAMEKLKEEAVGMIKDFEAESA